MSRSIRHQDRYTDIRRETQSDVDRAAAWQAIHERKTRNAKIKDRIVTWSVIGCLCVVVVKLFYVGTA